jgi:PIN domain nuclease of toxin-antitoxin system
VTSVVADSHAILWYVQGSNRLSEEASSALASAEVGDGIVVHVEPVDAVELGRAFMAELREPITDRSLDNKGSPDPGVGGLTTSAL